MGLRFFVVPVSDSAASSLPDSLGMGIFQDAYGRLEACPTIKTTALHCCTRTRETRVLVDELICCIHCLLRLPVDRAGSIDGLVTSFRPTAVRS